LWSSPTARSAPQTKAGRSNGIALTADGRTLVTAETAAGRILALDVGPGGALGGRRVFAKLDSFPDGLCLDEEGAAWTALPLAGRVVRVTEGGRELARIAPPVSECGTTIACALEGPERRILLICCGAEYKDVDKPRREGQGSVWTATVPVSGGSTRP
jgi:sugar lactone lactonase YvrE